MQQDSREVWNNGIYALNELINEKFEILGEDFESAGKASTRIKSTLKKIGIDPALIRRIGIVCYESEMNVVMYAVKGVMQLEITPKKIVIKVDDEGQGIENIPLAMQEGYSTATDKMRELGFGAGMGLPNIKKNADDFHIESTPGKGTSLRVEININ